MNCSECGKTTKAKYCSNACQQKAYRKRKETNVRANRTNVRSLEELITAMNIVMQDPILYEQIASLQLAQKIAYLYCGDISILTIRNGLWEVLPNGSETKR